MIRLDGQNLTAVKLAAIAGGATVELDPAALAKVAENRKVIDRILAEGRTVYGINTGFGQFATVVIPPHQLAQLQLNLIRSHAAGVGDRPAPGPDPSPHGRPHQLPAEGLSPASGPSPSSS